MRKTLKNFQRKFLVCQKSFRFLSILLFGFFIAMILAVTTYAADPNGKDTYAKDPSTAVNIAWTLITGFLVFLMQAGFALLGGGIGLKNMTNYLTKSYIDFTVAGLVFFLVGFAIMFGGSGLAPGLDAGNNYIGYSGFALLGSSYDVSTVALWFFQMVFAATAATIVAGCVIGRLKFRAYLLYTVVVSAIIYTIYGHWVWGGGWLADLGAVDFAGSGVVHAVGGFVGLAATLLLGPRIGKFRRDGKPNSFPSHNITYVVLGTFILFFGWFGFNPGSTLAATQLRIAVIAVTTFLAGAAGAVTVLLIEYYKHQKANIISICNGSLAGLVAITAPSAYVAPWAAVVIGVVAGILYLVGVWFFDYITKIDDPIGAISVHGINGLWGLISVGIFADGTYGVAGLIVGNTRQIIVQLVSAFVVFVWAFGMGLILFKIIDMLIGLRVSKEEELEGLDIEEHGLPAYPEFVVSKATRQSQEE